MLNNLYKIVLPFESKNCDKEHCDVYRGTAYFIFQHKGNKEKDNNKLIHNFGQLSEIKIGAANYSDLHQSKAFMSSKTNKNLKKYRLKAFNKFDWNYKQQGICRKKERSEFIGSVEEVNRIIMEDSVSLKNIDSFVSGSNPSGGLKIPNADPMRMVMDLPFLSKKINRWKIFSLLSNLDRKSLSPQYFNMEEINNIKEVEFSDFLKIKDIKVVPYGLSGFENDYVQIEEAFKAQNVEELYDEKFEEALIGVNLYTTSKEILEIIKKNVKVEQAVAKLVINHTDRNVVKNKLRQIWGTNIRSEMEKKKHDKDFLRGISRYQRAHIIEQNDILKKIYKLKDIDKIEQELKLLFKSENYILLPHDIHNLWDEDCIKISPDGKIEKTNKLSTEEYKQIFHSIPKSITEIYGNVLTINRKKLLEQRYWNN